MFDLNCNKCSRSCCTKRGKDVTPNVFKGDLGHTGEGFVGNLKFIGDDCAYLTPDRQCSIWSHSKRSPTCIAFPFVMDNEDRLYLRVTCPSYPRIIQGLIDRDPDVVKFVNGFNCFLITVDKAIKDFWTQDMKKDLVVVRIGVV